MTAKKNSFDAALDAAPTSWEPAPEPPPPAKQHLPQYDAQHARGKRWLGELVAIFIDTYPAYRPSYAECTLVFSCLYAISVRHDISPGQAKSLEMLRKKLQHKGVTVAPRAP